MTVKVSKGVIITTALVQCDQKGTKNYLRLAYKFAYRGGADGFFKSRACGIAAAVISVKDPIIYPFQGLGRFFISIFSKNGKGCVQGLKEMFVAPFRALVLTIYLIACAIFIGLFAPKYTYSKAAALDYTSKIREAEVNRLMGSGKGKTEIDEVEDDQETCELEVVVEVLETEVVEINTEEIPSEPPALEAFPLLSSIPPVTAGPPPPPPPNSLAPPPPHSTNAKLVYNRSQSVPTNLLASIRALEKPLKSIANEKSKKEEDPNSLKTILVKALAEKYKPQNEEVEEVEEDANAGDEWGTPPRPPKLKPPQKLGLPTNLEDQSVPPSSPFRVAQLRTENNENIVLSSQSKRSPGTPTRDLRSQSTPLLFGASAKATSYVGRPLPQPKQALGDEPPKETLGDRPPPPIPPRPTAKAAPSQLKQKPIVKQPPPGQLQDSTRPRSRTLSPPNSPSKSSGAGATFVMPEDVAKNENKPSPGRAAIESGRIDHVANLFGGSVRRKKQ